MAGSAGSTGTDHTSWKSPSASRFLRTTCTGPFGAGKRRDSSKVRRARFASSVVSHSPKMLAKPRE